MTARLPLLVAGALLVPAATAGAAERFTARAVGNSAAGTVTKTSFPIGANYGLRLTDRVGSRTRYRLCAYFGGRTVRCVLGRTGARGVYSQKEGAFIFSPQRTGRLQWRWTVNGRRVATVTLRITAGD